MGAWLWWAEQMGRTMGLFVMLPQREATLSAEEERRKEEVQEGKGGT